VSQIVKLGVGGDVAQNFDIARHRANEPGDTSVAEIGRRISRIRVAESERPLAAVLPALQPRVSGTQLDEVKHASGMRRIEIRERLELEVIWKYAKFVHA
jgi:hypothetical protein